MLERDAKGVVRALREQHRILTGSTPGDPKVLRLLPPLTIGDADVAQFLGALGACLR